VERTRTSPAGKACVSALGLPAPQGPARTAGPDEPNDRRTNPSRRAGGLSDTRRKGAYLAVELLFRNCGSKAVAITTWRITTGHNTGPRSDVAMATHAKKIVAPRLNTRRPRTVPRCDPAIFEGKQAMPNPKRAIPAKRASEIAKPSGVAANSSRHGKSGIIMKLVPTTISSHAAAMTTNVFSTFLLPRP
jgi:hypothetical protein